MTFYGILKGLGFEKNTKDFFVWKDNIFWVNPPPWFTVEIVKVSIGPFTKIRIPSGKLT